VTLRARHRTRPIRVVLDVADHALRADIADACEDAGIAVATPPPYPPPLAGEGREGEDADVVLADRPVESDVPMIALASGKAREGWPTEVRAVVPTDVDAATLEGASNKEIARTLAVSVHTAKFHVASLTEKLGARSRVEAIAIAIRAGLVMV
jgi:hypothetical protein